MIVYSVRGEKLVEGEVCRSIMIRGSPLRSSMSAGAIIAILSEVDVTEGGL